MAKIKNIVAREILDSRANPTIETMVVLENDLWAKASVPAGASTGKYEACELRDGNPERFLGKGVKKAIVNIEEKIAPALQGKEVSEQKEIDRIMCELDGTPQKANLGANAILSVSLATARTAALNERLPLFQYLRKLFWPDKEKYILPTPLFNMINGGKHSDSGLDIQEFLVIPKGANSFKEKLRIGAEIFYALREILASKGFSFACGDEGGFAPKLGTTIKVFDTLSQIANFTKHSLGDTVFFGFDAAANYFYSPKKKAYNFEGHLRKTDWLIKFYKKCIKEYPIFLIEDPLNEDDFDLWAKLTNEINIINPQVLIVGDDLFSTNIERLAKGIALKAANAILIKPNQIGTLSETVDCFDLAQKNGWQTIISHRSGETNDTFIADLAVAANASFIKAGAPNRGERVAKYNRLLEIEEII
ncbi:MAG: Enolase [Parcubacteria group bacterium ADurb.Bin159]|jgi:enolase|nr:MAG: Enolase [Parcubacteria group bacterium ADurb.Bin159]